MAAGKTIGSILSKIPTPWTQAIGAGLQVADGGNGADFDRANEQHGSALLGMAAKKGIGKLFDKELDKASTEFGVTGVA